MNKTKLVLDYLKEGHVVNSQIAFQKWGVTRLSAVIFNLRKKFGHESIETEMVKGLDRFGNNVWYGNYRMVKESQNEI